MVTAEMTECRDSALAKYVEFEKALQVGTRESFADLAAPVTTFDRFKKRIESFYAVTALEESHRRKDACHSCGCPKYQREASCKHSTNEGVESKMIVDPEASRMERRQKRGRPAKTKDALTRQPGEYQSDSSDDEIPTNIASTNVAEVSKEEGPVKIAEISQEEE